MLRPTPATARASRRTLAVIAAMAVVLGQLLAIWHHASVRHHWCAEHHDICEDEGGAPQGARSDTAERDQRVAPKPAIDAAAPRGSGGEHSDGCSLAGVSFTSTLTAASHPDAIADTQALRVEPREPVAPVSSRELLRIAPKTSPPLA